MIEEAYISLKTAKLAKEKKVYIEGFCEVYSTDGYIARTPNGGQWNWDKYKNGEFYLRYTQSLLARWLREKHNMCVEVYCIACNFIWNICKTDGTDTKSSEYSGPNDGGAWDSYEDAMENGLQEALKML